MLSVEIFLGYNCNYKCNFCFEFESKVKKGYKKEEVLNLITTSYEKGAKKIIFSGGEPTLDKNLLFFVTYSKKIGYNNILIHTNGTKFDDLNYLNDLYNNGLNGVIISIHGLKGISDLITGVKGSFDIINKALINFSKLKKQDKKFIIDTNTVICKQNKNILDKLFLYLYKFPISKRLFSFPNSTEFIKSSSLVKKNMKDFMLKYNEVEDKLFFINNFRKKYNINDLMLEGIPFCMVNRDLYGFLYGGIKQGNKMLFSNDIFDGCNDKDFSYIKYGECSKCSYNSDCYGFSKDYIAFYGKPNFINII